MIQHQREDLKLKVGLYLESAMKGTATQLSALGGWLTILRGKKVMNPVTSTLAMTHL